MRIAAELVGADLQRDLPGAAPDDVDRGLLAHAGAEQVEVVERALVGDGEAVLARARVLEGGAVRALERDRRPGSHRSVEGPGRGNRRDGERGGDHKGQEK